MALQCFVVDGALNQRKNSSMRWFWIALIVIVLSAADRALMGGQNAAFVMSGARSLAATVNRQVDDLLRYLRK